MNGRRTDREKKLYEDKIISIGKVTRLLKVVEILDFQQL